MDKQSKFALIKEELGWYGLTVTKSLGSGGFGEVVQAFKGIPSIIQMANA